MHILLVNVGFTEGDPEVYVLPLTHTTGAAEDSIRAQHGDAVVAQVQLAGQPGILYDASVDPAFAATLLELIGGRRQLRGRQGVLRGSTTPVYRRILDGREAAPAEPTRAEQTNTSITYGNVFFLKLYRRLEAGENPDVEMSRFLTEHGFQYTPALAGTLEYRRAPGRTAAVAMLQERVESQGDAWSYTLDALDRYFEDSLDVEATPRVSRASTAGLLELAGEPPTPEAERIGAFLQSVQLLGRRTAQMHAVLASDDEERAFAPEPFSVLYQRSLYQSLRNSTGRAFRLLARQSGKLPEPLRAEARRTLAQEAEIQKRLRRVTAEKIEAVRIRCHGDYHLGQVLYTGKDFIIIDFEGEPARPLGERRLKRPALYDVAGMLRSFHYAVSTALVNRAARSTSRESDTASLEPWARSWYQQVAAGFLRAYLAEAGDAPFLPRSQSGLEVLLDVLLLEKAIYEVGYELNNRPDWLWIPLAGIRELIAE
jgi:maltose alpha-D-glucosyltransferase/alpha-amylase